MKYYPFSKFITSGSYFTYQGVRYGCDTKFRFTSEYYKKHGKKYDPYFRKERFQYVVSNNGEETWHCWACLPGEHYENIVPDRDVWKIVDPVYYLTPKELVKKRFKDGTWLDYIWAQTLFYVFCLVISPLFYEWYLIWTIGLYIYLRTSYITLSTP